MTNNFYQIRISLTKDEFKVTQQLIKETTNMHLEMINNGNPIPAPTEEEKNIINSALHGLRIGFGIEEKNEQ